MKISAWLRATIFIVLTTYSLAGLAQQDIAGTWQGVLNIAPNKKINIDFIFKKLPDGSYTAVLDSSDNPNIKKISASKVQISGNHLLVLADALSGKYEGNIAK